ncbi:MAG: sugar transferase [Planctomycetes bacterium]|nr:sugar transferase [Planctomycetota bacterium]
MVPSFRTEDDFAIPASSPSHSLKRGVDVVLAAFLLVLSSPFILACAALVRISSRGPALYFQTRLGRFGKPFFIWKLRTMTHDCEKTSGARWAMRNDPRVTPIGKFLRITHFDELPQLWNVLKGDMSLVGPRPERPEFIPILEESMPRYRERMKIRPGVTGLAQVFLPPDTGIPSVRKKLQYDLFYIANTSLFLDLRLMIATVLQAIGLPSFLVRGALFLPAAANIEKPLETPRISLNTPQVIDKRSFESQPEVSA